MKSPTIEPRAVQFTPGPHFIRQQGDVLTLEKEADGLRSILCIALDAGLCPEHGGTVAGNMALYAAAPDLLAALVKIATQCGDFAEVQPALDYATIGNIARDAIAKAGGAL